MRKIILTLILIFVFVVVSALTTAGFVVRRYAQTFFTAAQVEPTEFIAMVREGWSTSPNQHNGVVSFLILGLDEVEGRDEQVLTDSMVLVVLHLDSGKTTMISIPRDLWIAEYKTKINALYFYGKERYPGHPEQFPKKVVEKITGIPVQYVVTVNLSQVGGLIDVLGGVDVQVQHSFTDPLFPRPGVDVSVEKDPKLLYESASFVQGWERMTGQRALVYMRSRYSPDPIEGTDDARSLRQQQVILAIVARLRTAAQQLDAVTLGRAYMFYHSTYGEVIEPKQLIAIGRALGKKALSPSFSSLDITPLLTNPPQRKYGQWVYEPIDPSWAALTKVILATTSATIAQ